MAKILKGYKKGQMWNIDLDEDAEPCGTIVEPPQPVKQSTEAVEGKDIGSPQNFRNKEPPASPPVVLVSPSRRNSLTSETLPMVPARLRKRRKKPTRTLYGLYCQRSRRRREVVISELAKKPRPVEIPVETKGGISWWVWVKRDPLNKPENPVSQRISDDHNELVTFDPPTTSPPITITTPDQENNTNNCREVATTTTHNEENNTSDCREVVDYEPSTAVCHITDQKGHIFRSATDVSQSLIRSNIYNYDGPHQSSLRTESNHISDTGTHPIKKDDKYGPEENTPMVLTNILDQTNYILTSDIALWSRALKCVESLIADGSLPSDQKMADKQLILGSQMIVCFEFNGKEEPKTLLEMKNWITDKVQTLTTLNKKVEVLRESITIKAYIKEQGSEEAAVLQTWKNFQRDEYNSAVSKMYRSLVTGLYRTANKPPTLNDLVFEIVQCVKFSTENKTAKAKLVRYLLNELDKIEFTEGAENSISNFSLPYNQILFQIELMRDEQL